MGIFSPLRIRTYKRYSHKIHEYDFVIDDHHTYWPKQKERATQWIARPTVLFRFYSSPEWFAPIGLPNSST